MALLLDTNILVWAGTGDSRLSPAVRELLLEAQIPLSVSAVTAWEFADLECRGRFPPGLTFRQALDGLLVKVLDFPADAWQLVASLPPIHKDPVDRMLVGHAIVSGLTIVTADEKMRRYPVTTFW